MRSQRRMGFFIGLWLIGTVGEAEAIEFTIVGSRAAGMGGAGVAVTTDATATYWNPAGLAMSKSTDIQIAGSVQIIDRQGFGQTLNDLNEADLTDGSPANASRIQALVNRLNQAGTSVSAMAAARLYFKTNTGHHAFGFNISDVATGGGFLPAPVTVTSGGGSVVVNGQMAVRGLEARQAAFSYAYALVDERFALGFTAKAIQGASYSNTVNVRGAEGGSVSPRISENPGFRAGSGSMWEQWPSRWNG